MAELSLKQQISDALGRGDFARAERLCNETATHLDPGETFFIRGVVRSAQGRLEDANALLIQARQALPTRSDIAYNHGVVLQQMGQLSAAVAAWQDATAQDPQNAAAWANLALGTTRLGDLQGALGLYMQALKYHPTQRDLLYNYANLLFRSGNAAGGEKMFGTLLDLYPQDVAGWVNRGMALKAIGNIHEAEVCYRKAITLNDPSYTAQAHFNLANLLLQQGRWREGFAAHEWRAQMPKAITAPWNLPRWTPGLAKGGRVLLWNDQGLGDAMMFVRFAPFLAQKGYALSAFVQEPLKDIIATAPGIERVFTPLDDPQQFDAALPLGSLPFALELDAITGAPPPYLHAPDLSAYPLPQKHTMTKRIGLVWAGNPSHSNDAERSMKLTDLAALFTLPGIEWYSLQLGTSAAELAASPSHEQIHDLSPFLTGFTATAAFLAQLDLMISVDTAPAHLAGAMGRPTWTLLPAKGTDWRWGTAGSDSPWYPTMQLFRQTQSQNWADVVAMMAHKLAT